MFLRSVLFSFFFFCGIYIVSSDLLSLTPLPSPDVNSWLVTFGFHLHNTIPGFPVPKFDLSMPSYELSKSQRWDDLPVGRINLSGADLRQNKLKEAAAAFLLQPAAVWAQTDTRKLTLFPFVFLLRQYFEAAVS